MYVVKLAIVGMLGGAAILIFSPLFGALLGLNAAIIWAALSILLFKLTRIVREPNT